MNLKVIQVNIYKGRYLDELAKFLKGQKPDFITMQEVTTGSFNNYPEKDLDLFSELKKRLAMTGVYHGDLKLEGQTKSRMGNAVFSRWPIVKRQVIALKTFRPVTLDELDGSQAEVIRPQIDRHLLDVTLDLGGRCIHVISVHGAWTAPPIDNHENLRQAKIITGHLKSLTDQPFIVGGDLNMPPATKVIAAISKQANNLMLGSGVVGTLNQKVHKIAPRNFLVDYIFCSKNFRLKSLKVPRVTVSDHLPVVVELEF